MSTKTDQAKGLQAAVADDGVPSNREFELKLDVDPVGLDALRGSDWFSGEAAITRQQDATYFDTAGQALRKAGFALRVRTIEGRHIQTLKAEGAAAGLFVRPEWEREIAGTEPVLDDETPLRGLIPREELASLGPVFRVEIMRTTVLLHRAGAAIELVLDQGNVLADDRTDPIQEIEIELKQGDPAEVFRLAREIGRVVPLRLGVLSKSQRGYRLGRSFTDKPVKSVSTALSPEMPIADGFAAIVGACLRQFRLNETILVRTGDAEALHQARVALRRLRSALSTFRRIVDDARYQSIVAELRWIAAALGCARNLDVLLKRMPDDGPATVLLRAARDLAYTAVIADLASERLRDLMLDIAEWSAIGPWTTDSGIADRYGSMQTFAAGALDRHRRRLKRNGRKLDKVGDDERHEARIEAKKLRYAAEFFAGVFPGKKAARRRQRFLEALEALQDDLGTLNDIATAPLVLAALDLPDSAVAGITPPDTSKRKSLLKRAADDHAMLMDSKRFWR